MRRRTDPMEATSFQLYSKIRVSEGPILLPTSATKNAEGNFGLTPIEIRCFPVEKDSPLSHNLILRE
jgi:hypothetical protein